MPTDDIVLDKEQVQISDSTSYSQVKYLLLDIPSNSWKEVWSLPI